MLLRNALMKPRPLCKALVQQCEPPLFPLLLCDKQVGVQGGHFMEILLLTWDTVEVLFGVDPWFPQVCVPRCLLTYSCNTRLR